MSMEKTLEGEYLEGLAVGVDRNEFLRVGISMTTCLRSLSLFRDASVEIIPGTIGVFFVEMSIKLRELLAE